MTPAIKITGLGSSHFARHYYGNHYLFSFPPDTKMFQFSGFASKYHVNSDIATLLAIGCPIRKFPDHSLFPAPRNLSQDIASFVAYQSQVIHHTLLVTYISVKSFLRSVFKERESRINIPLKIKRKDQPTYFSKVY